MSNIRIAADHAGYALKQIIATQLQAAGHTLTDHGTHSADSMDYPDVVHPLAQALQPSELGIIICGSGNGVCITANKYAHIRAALVWAPELASLARQHNDANVLCLPARFIDEATAWHCVQAFVTTAFEGGRHQRRVDKMARP
jgi:ribose 5-phosphate isomerase B